MAERDPLQDPRASLLARFAGSPLRNVLIGIIGLLSLGIFGLLLLRSCANDPSGAQRVASVDTSTTDAVPDPTADASTSTEQLMTTTVEVAAPTAVTEAAPTRSLSAPCSLLSTDVVGQQFGGKWTAKPGTGTTPDEQVCEFASSGKHVYVSVRSPFTADAFAQLRIQYGGTDDANLSYPAFRAAGFISQLKGDALITVAADAAVTSDADIVALEALSKAAAA